MVLFGTKLVWTSSLAILDTGVGPSLVEEDFFLAVCDPSGKEVKLPGVLLERTYGDQES